VVLLVVAGMGLYLYQGLEGLPTARVVTEGLSSTTSVPLVASVTGTREIALPLNSSVTALAVSGRLLGSGSVRMTLVRGSDETLVYEGSSGVGAGATASQSSFTAVASHTSDNPPDKSVSAAMRYTPDTAWDRHDNGIEQSQQVIDVDVSATQLTGIQDATKLCTRWTLENEQGAVDEVCTGSLSCCAFMGLDALAGRTWESLDLFDGMFGLAGKSQITAEVVYYDVNLSIENLRTDVVYSEPVALPVRWVGADEVLTITDRCMESCTLNATESGASAVLRVETTGDVVAELDAVALTTTTVPEILWRGPSNISIIENGTWTGDVRTWFRGKDLRGRLTYSVQGSLNLQAALDDTLLTITPDLDFTGERDVTVIATDGTTSREMSIAVMVVAGAGTNATFQNMSMTSATNATLNTTVNESFRQKITGKQSYKASEHPQFVVDVPLRNRTQGTGGFGVQAQDIFEAKIVDAVGVERILGTEIVRRGQQYTITLNTTRSFRPGLYRLLTTSIVDGVSTLVEQNFTWGVLAVNTQKSIYATNETAFIGMAVLNDRGEVVCDANVTLTIRDPENQTMVVSTDAGTIHISPECQVYGVTSEPDYYTSYNVSGPGTYTLEMVATIDANATRTLDDSFRVEEEPLYDVLRLGPTRIYPYVPYNMSFVVTSTEVFNGVIRERVPASFSITPQSGMTVVTRGDTTELLWTGIQLTPAEQQTFSYTFDAPDISPEFYVLGALEIGTWSEARQWQIASDVKTVGAVAISSPTAGQSFVINGTFTDTCSVTVIGTGGSVNFNGNWTYCTGAGCTAGATLLTSARTDLVGSDADGLHPITNTNADYTVSQTITARQSGTYGLACAAYAPTGSKITSSTVSITVGYTLSTCAAITAPGNYNVSGALSGTASCVVISSSDVVLDCLGNTITYGSAGTGIGINISSNRGISNITVKSCNIQKSGTLGTDNYGIYMKNASSVVVMHNSISTNGTSFNDGIDVMDQSRDVILFNNSIRTQGSTAECYGVWVKNATNVNITGNTIFARSAGNVNDGIYLRQSHNNTITFNVVNTSGTSNNLGLLVRFSSNNTIVNNNFTATGSTTDNYGIDVIEGSNDNIFRNNNIRTSGTSANFGFVIDASYRTVLFNTTINTAGTAQNYGLYLTTNSTYVNGTSITTRGTTTENFGLGLKMSSHNLFYNTSIDTSGTTTSYGIYLLNASVNNTFVGGQVTTRNVTSYGIFAANSGTQVPRDNVVRDIVVSAGRANHVHIDTASSASITHLINVTYDTSNVTFVGAPSGNLNVSWYARAFASATNQSSVVGAAVNVTDVNGAIRWSDITDGNGYTPWYVINDYFQNNTGKFTSNNHQFNASHASFSALTKTQNVSETMTVNFTFAGPGALASCQDITTSGNYLMLNEVSTTGTCYQITANDVVLDCAGYTVTYGIAAVGHAVNVSSAGATHWNNITVMNCTLVKGSAIGSDNYAIRYTNVSNGSILNNQIRTNGTGLGIGILVDQGSSRNTISNTVIQTDGSGTYDVAIYVQTSYSNIVRNNSLSTKGTDFNAGILLDTTADNNTISLNFIRTQGSATNNRGVWNYLSSGNIIDGNTIFTNGTTTNIGIASDGGVGVVISNNTIRTNGTNNNYGVYDYFSTIDSHDSIIRSNDIVTSGTSGNNYGIYLSLDGNITVRDNSITTSGTSGNSNYGLWIYQSENHTVINNTITTSGAGIQNFGILFSSGSSTVVGNNTISTLGNDSAGMKLWLASSHNTFYGNSILTRNLTSYGIYFLNDSTNYPNNNTFYNTIVNSTRASYVVIETGLASIMNYFLNVTFNASNVSFMGSSSGKLNVSYYTRAYVASLAGTPSVGANVTADDATGSFAWNATTDATGYTPWFTTFTYVQNNSGIFTVNKYDFNASSGSKTTTQNVNVTSSTTVALTFGNDAPVLSSVVLSGSAGGSTATENISLTITSSDTDGDAYTNITNWFLNDESWEFLNLPFDTNTTSMTRNYNPLGSNATLNESRYASSQPFWNASCVAGGCYQFNGINQFITVPVTGIEKNLTFEFWAKTPANISSLNVTADLCIFDAGIVRMCFTSAGALEIQFQGVAGYTGTSTWWDTGGPGSGSNTDLTVLGVWNGSLYGGLYATGRVYRYNGSGWEDTGRLGTGTDVASMTVHNGSFFAGNDLGRVYRYSGTSWVDTGLLGTANYVDSLASWNGSLYAGKGTTGDVWKYNGTGWQNMSRLYPMTHIYALTVWNGSLIAGATDNTNTVGGIYRYNGTGQNWSYLGRPASTVTGVYSLAEWNGTLYVGTTNQGGVYSYNGTNWTLTGSAIPSAVAITSLAVYNGTLYAGTRNNAAVYAYIGGSWVQTGQLGTPNLYAWSMAVWNGSLWSGGADASGGANGNGHVYRYGNGSSIRVLIDARTSEYRSYALRINQTSAQLYINGILNTTLTIPSFGVIRSPLQIGRGWGGAGPGANSGLYFNGFIDEFRLYNRSLTADQILSNYNSGVPRYDRIVSQELVVGQQWYANVTPSDGKNDGTTVKSNVLTVVELAVNSTCQNISTSGTTTLINNVTSTGNCFQINVSNVVLDCAGYTITYGTSGTGNGINVSNSTLGSLTNVTVNNCTILKTGGGGANNYGIQLMNVSTGLVSNLRVMTNGTNDNYGIVLSSGSVNITVVSNTVTTNGSSGSNYGIYVDDSDSNNILGNVVSTGGSSNNHGLYLAGGSRYNNGSSNNITVGRTTGNRALYLASSHNNSFSDNQIVSQGTSSNDMGIYLSGSESNVFLTSTVTTSCTATCHGIYLTGDSMYNQFSGLSIQTTTPGAAGIYLFYSGSTFAHQNTFRDIIIDATNADDIIVNSNNASSINHLINVTFNATNISFIDALAGNLNVSWYVRAFVNATNQTSVQNANVTFNNTLGSYWNGLTDANGYTNWSTVQGYVQNNSGIFFAKNYTVNVTSGSFSAYYEQQNVTESMTLNVTMQATASGNPYTIAADSFTSTLTLNGSVSGILTNGQTYTQAQNVTFLNGSRRFVRFLGLFNESSVDFTTLTIQNV